MRGDFRKICRGHRPPYLRHFAALSIMPWGDVHQADQEPTGGKWIIRDSLENVRLSSRGRIYSVACVAVDHNLLNKSAASIGIQKFGAVQGVGSRDVCIGRILYSVVEPTLKKKELERSRGHLSLLR